MMVETRELGGTVVVGLEGDMDLQHSPTVRRTLLDLMAERRHVLVEMSRVGYLDSSGIASLVEAYQLARRNGTRFILAAVSEPALRVLQLARLDKVFAIAPSVEDGIGV